MKIYSKSQFLLGMLWAGLLWAHTSKGETGIIWLLICGVNTASCLYRALDKKQPEVTKDYEEASRQLFGRGHILVENLGAIVIFLALLRVLWFPDQVGMPVVLIICGFVYTFFIGNHIRKHTNH